MKECKLRLKVYIYIFSYIKYLVQQFKVCDIQKFKYCTLSVAKIVKPKFDRKSL